MVWFVGFDASGYGFLGVFLTLFGLGSGLLVWIWCLLVGILGIFFGGCELV